MCDSESFRYCELGRKGYVNNAGGSKVDSDPALSDHQVTLHLPDSLPAPHEAPFWMKVGEAGEAFFVVETDEEVPEELQTSPVMSATEMSPPASPDFSGRGEHPQDDPNNLSATQEPFGKGKGDISLSNSPEPIQAVSTRIHLQDPCIETYTLPLA